MKKPRKPVQTKIAVGQQAPQFEPVAIYVPMFCLEVMANPAPQYAPVALVAVAIR